MPPKQAQSSFIPKRSTSRKKRRKPVRKVFLFTIISYSLIFAALLVAGASYLYKNYVTSLMQDEVQALNVEIDTFSVAQLGQVTDFDLTLKRANDRFYNTASISALLEAIERSVAEPVQLEDFSVTRVGDMYLEVSAKVVAQSFDSALFQRTLLNADQNLFSTLTIEELAVDSVSSSEDDILTPQADQLVTYSITTQVPISALSDQSRNANSI